MVIDFEWYKLMIPLAAGGIGFLVRYAYDKKKELQAPVNTARRDVYKKFITMVVDDFKETGAAVKKVQEEAMGTQEMISKEAFLQRIMAIKQENITDLDAKMYDFYVDYMLYASPDVINAFGAYRQYLFDIVYFGLPQNERTNMEKLAKVIYEMRDDLGLRNKGLGKYGEVALRGVLMDYREIFK